MCILAHRIWGRILVAQIGWMFTMVSSILWLEFIIGSPILYIRQCWGGKRGELFHYDRDLLVEVRKQDTRGLWWPDWTEWSNGRNSTTVLDNQEQWFNIDIGRSLLQYVKDMDESIYKKEQLFNIDLGRSLLQYVKDMGESIYKKAQWFYADLGKSFLQNVKEMGDNIYKKLPSRLRDSGWLVATEALVIVICVLLLHHKEQQYRKREQKRLRIIKKLDEDLFYERIKNDSLEEKNKELQDYISQREPLKEHQNVIKKEHISQTEDENKIIRQYLEGRVAELNKELIKTRTNAPSEKHDHYREEIQKVQKSAQKTERELNKQMNEKDMRIHQQWITERMQNRLIDSYRYETRVLRQKLTLMAQTMDWIPVYSTICVPRQTMRPGGMKKGYDNRPNRTRMIQKHRMKLGQTIETILEED